MAGAGSLNSRVHIQRASITYSETNQPLEHWGTIATRWGEVKKLSGTEAVKARQVQAEASYQIRMRDGFDLLESDRLVDSGGKVLNILSIVPDDSLLVILAGERIGDAYHFASASLSMSATLSATAL